MKQISKALLIEIAWLLGSWAFSLLVLGRAIGYDKLIAETLDVQMHNSYFVLSPFALSIPLLTSTMAVQTGLRLFLKRSRSQFTGWVCGISLLLVLAMLALSVYWAK